MTGDLARFAKQEMSPRKQDRAVAAAAKLVFDEVRLAALKADGAIGLAGHIMEGMTGLDERRQTLSTGDRANDIMLTEIQIAALRAVKAIQAKLYNQWGM